MIHKLSHGEATCGILARVVGASAPTASGPLGALCRAAEVPFDADHPSAAAAALARRMDALLRDLALPRTLGELRIRREDLPELARRAGGDFAARSRSARIWSQAEIESLLEASL
jgi:alcohol dehydrogenase class IV